MYMVRYNYPEVKHIAYKVFKTLEEATVFSKTVDLVEIKEVSYE